MIYYDQKERTNSTSSRNQEKLKDRCDSSPNLCESIIHVKCPLHLGSTCCIDNENNIPENENKDKLDNERIQKELFVNKKIEIVQDIEGKLHWKLYVPIGGDFVRNKTSVKALSGGRRLILMAYKLDSTDGQKLQQYIEKLSLPHAINAYGVKATMDKIGNLKINAAISDQLSIPDGAVIPTL